MWTAESCAAFRAAASPRRLAAGAGDGPFEQLRVDGLREVVVEARFDGLFLVLSLAVTRQRDQPDVARGGVRAEPSGDFVAVDLGKADVDDRDVGRGRGGELQRLAAVRRFRHVMPLQR